MNRTFSDFKGSRAGLPPEVHPPFRIPHSAFKIAKPPKASSLVTTLLVMVVLSTIVVAFMQSMSVERSVAKSVKNKLQADLAVQAGMDDAAQRIANILATNPYHAVGYTNVGSQMLTMIVGAPSYTNTSLASTNYLLSLSNMGTPPGTLTTSNSIALNFSNSRPSGWIGSPVNAAGSIVNRECRAPWVYLLKNPALPHQPDSTLANHNPYVTRFAYWIEDETSKIDVMAAGNANGAGGRYLKPTNMVSPQDSDLGAAPLVGGLALPTNATTTNSAIFALRNQMTNFPLVQGFLSYVPGLSTNSAETSRFYTTMGSYASDLAGSGQKRINLNAIVTEGFATNTITSDLDDLIYSITGTHPYPGLSNSTDTGLFHDLPNTNGLFPNFGSRFYAGATAPHKGIYLKKIAANIRDYIDADSQPTIINTLGVVEGAAVPVSWWNSWPPQAIGKEAVPYLQETAWTGNEVSWSGSGSSRTATLEIDHYLEFFNPSTKDFVAPAGTKITLSNLASWSTGAFPAVEPDDFDLDISGVKFPAGKVTIITTNPGPPMSADPPSFIQASGVIERIVPAPEEGTRKFSSRNTDETVTSGGVTEYAIQLGYPPRNSTLSDTESRLIIAGPHGIFEALPKYGFTGASGTAWNFKGKNIGDRIRFIYAASLMGNTADGRSGDPRSLSEQLEFQAWDASNKENTRFYGTIQGNGLSTDATFGKAAPPISFVDPTKSPGTLGAWGDYSQKLDDTSATAYADIRDGSMASIGELGNIYDPYRLASPTGIKASRGGGRTLKVGQPDDVIGAPARFSANWQNAAWRLTDIFGANSNRSQAELDPVSRGKINVNSVMRDGGTALRALLRSFIFLPSPQSDPNTASKLLINAEVNNLILSISNYIKANGPIMERGELSQISFFSTNLSVPAPTLAGQPVRTTADRGREEIYRRMSELVTTRSASYSVYCVGEAVQESAAGTIKPLARSQSGAVFRFDPSMPSALRSQATNFQATKLYEIQ
ncbi:MAG: pilus assembly PilX N-terminal domain-containing protein [Terrimicrobiaceae bacterium]